MKDLRISRPAVVILLAILLTGTCLADESPAKDGWLGIWTSTLNEARSQQLKLNVASGAYVDYVVSDSPVKRGGVQEGDVIVGIDGQPIVAAPQFLNGLVGKKPGEKLVLKLLRHGQSREVPIVLGDRPSDDDLTNRHVPRAEQGNVAAQHALGWSYHGGTGIAKDEQAAIRWFRRSADQNYPYALNALGFCYREGKGIPQDFAESLRLFQAAAELGNEAALFHLGFSYEHGKGVNQNHAEAVKWYRQAAERGLADAENNLGVMYRGGKGVDQDLKQAAHWYGKAAEHGNAIAQNNLANLLEDGLGVPQDYQAALLWYRKAAGQNYAPAQNSIGRFYEFAKGVTQDYQEAVKWYRKAADQGNASAQFNLADMYEHGKGVETDYPEALKWYRKAAEQNHATAQNRIGRFYEFAQGVTQDYQEAVKWYRKAADQGNASAQYNLGDMYEYGKGVDKDYQEALQWYQKAAEQNYATAQNSIGRLHEFAKGVPRNEKEAVEWYRKAAEQGNASGQYNLGDMYQYGTGVAKDEVAALKWFRKAADQGHASAQYQLGIAYEFGKGVAQDEREALTWYQKAAGLNNPSAQSSLGRFYEFGKAVTEDHSQAVTWYRKAAEQGYSTGQYNLADMYERGKGVTQDLIEAAKWYQKAADQGDTDAQIALGQLYEAGEGVPRDRQRASELYRLAADQGIEEAKDLLASLTRAPMPEDALVPEDTCVVELRLPTGARIYVDGTNYGRRRLLRFTGLERQRVYVSKCLISYREGSDESVTLLIRGGQRISLLRSRPGILKPELALQSGHSQFVMDAALSADGRYALTGSFDGTTILWDLERGRQLRTYVNPGRRDFRIVTKVGFLDDDTKVVAASHNSTVAVFDRDSGNVLKTCNVQRAGAVAISPDSRTFAARGANRNIDLWDFATGKITRSLDLQLSGDVYGLAYSSDGKQLLVVTDDHSLVIADVATGKRIRTLSNVNADSRCVAFSPEGRKIAAGVRVSDSEMSQIVIWDIASGDVVSRSAPFPAQFRRLQFTDDAGALVVQGRRQRGDELENELISYDAESLEPRKTVANNLRNGALAIDSARGRLFDGGEVWDVTTGARLGGCTSHADAIKNVRWMGDGKRVLIQQWQNKACVLDLFRGVETRVFQLPEGYVSDLILSPTDRRLLGIVRNEENANDVIVFDVAAGEQVARFPIGITKDYIRLSTNADGSRLVTVADRKATLWDVNTGKPIRNFGDDKFSVWHAALSPDGRTVITNAPGAVPKDERKMYFPLGIVWNSETGQQIRTLQFAEELVKGKPVRLFAGSLVAFTPDGTKAITVYSEAPGPKWRFVLWDLSNGNLLPALDGYHPNMLNKLVFTPDGRFAISEDVNENIILWDILNGQRLRTVSGHHDFFVPAALSPDGRRLLTLPGDGSLELQDVATGDSLLRLTKHVADEGWLAVTPEGLFDGSTAAFQHIGYRIGGGLNVVPADRFFNDFYHPGLWQEVMRGRRLLPEIELGKNLPPTLKIVSAPPQETETAEISVAVEATDEGGGIAPLTLYQNGARVLAPGEKRQEEKVLHRSFRVALVEGDNRLRITSASADGSWESEPAEISVRYTKPLAKSRLYLVAIGINRYADANLNLSFAAADAKAVSELSTRRGKHLYEAVQSTTLINEQATKTAIQAALQQVAGQTRPQDTLILYMAGHGALVGQRYYFVPQEFRKQAERLDDDIRQQGLPADALSEYMGNARALKRVFILDTCASGGALGSVVKGRSGFELRGAIERLSRSQGVFTIAASAATEQAQEVKELGHGVLTYALLAGLGGVTTGPLADRHVQPGGPDQVVDVLDWFSFASGQVPRLTEKYFGNSQEVQTSSQGASFPLLPLSE